MIPILGDRFVLTESGHFVAEKQLLIHQALQEYDKDLHLLWIPPEKREPGDKPFCVMHTPVGREPYVVMYADELDERIFDRLIAYDLNKNDVMSGVELNNLAVKEQQKKKAKEQMEEAHDIAKHVFASPKTTYTAEGVKYKTHEPAERIKERD